MFLPSHTNFQALQRFSIFSELFYPQTITWDRSKWEPKSTAKIKLIPWYLLSVLMTAINLRSYFTLFHQLLSHEKDPDITFEMCLYLLLYCAAFTSTSVIGFTYVTRADGILFILRSLCKNAGIYI